MKKNLRKALLSFVLLLSVFTLFGMSSKVEAASKLKELNANQTYTTKLTGSKSYKLKYTQPWKKNKYHRNLELYINGKLKKKITNVDAYFYSVQLLTVNSKRVLIAVTDFEDNDYTSLNQIYEYKNNKLVLLQDLGKLTVSYGTKTTKLLTGWARGYIDSFDGKTIVMRWIDSTTATGNIQYAISYNVSGSKIKKNSTSNTVRDGKTGKSNPKWTAKYTLTAYQTAGGKKKAFTVKPGEKVTLKLMTVKNGKRYLQLTNRKGKTGWILNPSDYDSKKPNGYFKECFFAG